jgi:hypothetical protein
MKTYTATFGEQIVLREINWNYFIHGLHELIHKEGLTFLVIEVDE